LTKRDIKVFFSIISSTFERKIKLLWKDIFKEKTQIEVNEAIELLQVLDYSLNQDSTIFHENISRVFDKMVSKIPDGNINVDSFTHFIKTNRICNPLVKQLNLIEGKQTEDILIETESDEEEDAFKTENEPNLDKFTRSHRFSSPTLNSSKGRASNSRKSFLGIELEKERHSIGPTHKDEVGTDDIGRTKSEVDHSPFERAEGPTSIANTDENMPGIKPPTFLVRFPIMSSKVSTYQRG